MHGFGSFFLDEGEKFSGCFKRGVVDGYGCFYKNSGELISGLWFSGHFQKM